MSADRDQARNTPPWHSLLAQLLVTYTIEFDNEFEHRMPHSVTGSGKGLFGGNAGRRSEAARGPWLVSQVMWANTMRYVPEAGTTLAQLREHARTANLSLAGLHRWRYVDLEPPFGNGLATRPREDTTITPTKWGRRAQHVWEPLNDEIDTRWAERFGADRVAMLRSALEEILKRRPESLPRYLPIVYPSKNGGRTERPSGPTEAGAGAPARGMSPESQDLSCLISRVIHAFTLDFEVASKISMAICANTLRVLEPDGTPLRELPVLTGISKEANAMVIGFLERHGLCTIAASPTATGRSASLSAKGMSVKKNYVQLTRTVAESWEKRYGKREVAELRASIHLLCDVSPSERGFDPRTGPISDALRGYPDGWRTHKRRPLTLPLHPMVLHRGGYPDGS